MSQRFHFDLTDGDEIIRDDEGVEASSHDEAIAEAQAALNEMRGTEEAVALEDGWRLVIRDESGVTVGRSHSTTAPCKGLNAKPSGTRGRILSIIVGEASWLCEHHGYVAVPELSVIDPAPPTPVARGFFIVRQPMVRVVKAGRNCSSNCSPR